MASEVTMKTLDAGYTTTGDGCLSDHHSTGEENAANGIGHEPATHSAAASCTSPLTVKVHPTSADQDGSLDSRPSVTSSRYNPVSNAVASASTSEEGRTLRKARKRTSTEAACTCCPVCGVTLRQGEVTSHFSLEIDKLDRIHRGRKSYCGKDTGQGKKSLVTSSSNSTNNTDVSDAGDTSHIHAGNRYETYLRVRADRMSRMSGRKNRKKKNETACPVCNLMISGTSEELNQHVDLCLSNKVAENEDVDIEGDDGSYEEYTWAGQTRIRATTMLDGGSLAGTGMKAGSKDAEEDVDLIVDDDDEQEFGSAQYRESDIILCVSEEVEEDKERKALRRAYLKAKGEKVPRYDKLPGDRRRWEEAGSSSQPSCSSRQSSDDDDDDDSDVELESQEQYRQRTDEIIAALRTKLKEQADQLSETDHPKCLICMESYQKPLVSVHCWHVHCEECWLRTLGAKKLCPQCNTITSAVDLRRIFL